MPNPRWRYRFKRWKEIQVYRFKNTKPVKRFIAWFPLVWKKNAQVEKQLAVNQLNNKYAIELEQERHRVDELIGKLTRLTWSRDGEVYKCGIAFDARIMFGYGTRDNNQFIAQMIARQVEHEIASSRFIQKAEESRFDYPERKWVMFDKEPVK